MHILVVLVARNVAYNSVGRYNSISCSFLETHLCLLGPVHSVDSPFCMVAQVSPKKKINIIDKYPYLNKFLLLIQLMEDLVVQVGFYDFRISLHT